MLKLSDELHIPTMREVIRDREAAASAKKPRSHKRQYAAAKVNRLNSGWTTQPTTANYELRQSLAPLRARAREMCRDNSHFKKFLSMVRSNVVGPKGIQLQVRARNADGSLNTDLNKRVETAFKDWGKKRNCTLSGRLSWKQVQRLAITQMARDGEFLCAHLPAKNGYGYALKLINVDYLDETYNDTLPGGNRVIMSVEIDDSDRVVAYYLTTPSSDIMFTKRRTRVRTRVPVENISHGFLVFDDEGQCRGVTWFHAAMLDARNLGGYKEGVITSARMTANWVGFIEQEVGDDIGLGDDPEEDDEGNPQPVEIDNSPGQINMLEPGMKINQIDPKQPTQNHPAFYKSILTDLAVALDVPYFDLAGDMEAVNFSSARVGQGTAREIWRELQDWLAEELLDEVYRRWTRSALLAKGLKLTTAEYVEIQDPTWRPRGWQYIDPQKETAANVVQLENNLTSLTAVLSEQGIDLVDHFEEIKAEREMAASFGIDLIYNQKATAKVVAGDGEDNEDPPEKDENEETDAETDET